MRNAGGSSRIGRTVGLPRVLGAVVLTYAVGVGTGLGLPVLAKAQGHVAPIASPRLSAGDIIAANLAAAVPYASPRLSAGDIIAANLAATKH